MECSVLGFVFCSLAFSVTFSATNVSTENRIFYLVSVILYRNWSNDANLKSLGVCETTCILFKDPCIVYDVIFLNAFFVF